MNKLKQTCKREFPIGVFVYPTLKGARGKITKRKTMLIIIFKRNRFFK